MTGQAPNPMSPREPLRPPQRATARPAPAAAPASAGAWLGRALVRLLSRRRHVHGVSLPTDPALLATCLRPGDVLLVEGDSRFSVGTQYLTQSTWSHAALYVGAALGDPTRAICSTLVAEAFQSVHYPILPRIERRDRQDPLCPGRVDEILHVRHHSLFVPRDFDVSPYFQVVKPTLEAGFDPRRVSWAQAPSQEASA